ncbi:MAG: hypothetical protein ACLPHP_01275 [Candidatus Sulfotelmatobacter sp.]
MKQQINWLVVGCVLVFVVAFVWTHRQHPAPAGPTPAQQEAETDATYDEVHDAQRAVTVAGPLANYMAREGQAKVETLQPISHKPIALDHVGGSVVGTSSAILHQTFAVASIVNLPFEVPAHAASPQLRGNYRSFVKPAGGKPGETESSDAANVDFLVLNEAQYAEFLNGRDSEAVFSADDAYDQEVNTGLPPTVNQPAKYHLVFRNSSPKAGKKVVQADFRIDF